MKGIEAHGMLKLRQENINGMVDLLDLYGCSFRALLTGRPLNQEAQSRTRSNKKVMHRAMTGNANTSV